ncbi:hypothetical protein BDV25DRAFT_135037 [Aspergillus avenaceus]|uniref:Clavaminate synthase-like protein n=1 Tax=Aspergillus avenaceus TaxID=36643 RepID=A0A5N6U9M1_ASPAV|nr:hypothetical protein BDV25DRAFT_135037 [Aspergillus avenaceus]
MSNTAAATQESPEMASIKTINMGDILAREPVALRVLLDAARSPGFFYVDFREPSTADILEELPDMFALVKEYFCQPEHEKMKSYYPNEECGYKRYAQLETFEFALDDHSNGLFNYPGFQQNQKRSMMPFSERCHKVAMQILSALSDGLMRQGTERFENKNLPGMPSDSGFMIYCAPTQARVADVEDNAHTDEGTLTLMFFNQLCMQLKHPRTNEYQWIEHRPGQMLVNVGNSLVEHSNGEFYSCLHRAMQPEDGVEERYLLSYLLRPGKSA